MGQNGKVGEHFINTYNYSGLLERKEYFDGSGNLLYYSVHTYDNKGNCIEKRNFDNQNELTGSFEWTYDEENREISSIERTVDGTIYQWFEKYFHSDNLLIWLVKDENGKIIHRTEENLKNGSEKRFNEKGELYSIIKKSFDNKRRLLEQLTFDKSGQIIEKDEFQYNNNSQIWKLYLNEKFIKSEERTYDEKGNEIFYIRKDEKGNCLEWVKCEYDEFGSPINVKNGVEIDKVTHVSRIEIEYLKQ